MKEEEIEQELENNKADMVFPTNEGYVKVENIERVRDVIISKSHRFSKIIERSELKGKTFKAEITIKDTVTLILLLAEEKEPEEGASIFSPVISSPKQRIKFKDWEAVANTKKGMRVYKEVISRMLEEYKDGVAPATEIFSQIIREMYGEHLKGDSIATYTSLYKRYITENKLAIMPPQEDDSVKTALDASIKSVEEDLEQFKPKGKELHSMEKVAEIWDLLPDEFEYKQVKAQVPISIMQSTSRIDTANYIIKQFLDNPAFACVETSPGVFKKKE